MIKKKSSNRSFGLLFFVVFLLIGIWPLFKENDYRLWSLIISIIFLILGLLNSKLLNPLNNLWIKFGEILGKIIAPIVMMIVFFAIMSYDVSVVFAYIFQAWSLHCVVIDLWVDVGFTFNINLMNFASRSRTHHAKPCFLITLTINSHVVVLPLTLQAYTSQ